MNSPSEELKVLFKILQSLDVSINEVQQEHFIQLIGDHRLTSTIYNNTKTNASLHQLIESYYVSNKFNQLLLTSTLQQVSESLNEINWIILKGPSLSQTLYDDPCERTSKDLDILIEAEFLDEVIHRLTSSGFLLKTFFKTKKQQSALVKYHHHIEFTSPNGEISVEVHWKLLKDSLYSFDVTKIMSQKVQQRIGEKTYWKLDEETEIIYLVLHGIHHGFFRLQWLNDIYHYFKKYPQYFSNAIVTNKENTIIENSFLATFKLIELIYSTDIKSSFLVSTNKNLDKIERFCMEEIIANDSFSNKIKSSGLKNTIRFHRLNYLIGGRKLLFKSILSRNVRPNNWKTFAFPDSVFFLNHLFSRPISLFNKLMK